MAFQLVQILYWLALSTWFGGALFIFVASRVIIQTVQEAKPILPHVLSVNLEGQHGTLLGGTIVGNLIAIFIRIELACCGVLLVTLAADAFLINLTDPAIFLPMVMRGLLLVCAGAVVIYDWRFLWPRIWRYRQEFLDHADEPEKANPAKDQFDRYQRENVVMMELLVFLLLGLVFFSGSGSLSASHRAPGPAPDHQPGAAALSPSPITLGEGWGEGLPPERFHAA